MKRIRTQKVGSQLRASAARPVCLLQQSLVCRRLQSTQAASNVQFEDPHSLPPSFRDINELPSPPTPPPEAALRSAKLAALHARLSLPQSLPLQTLARTLIDASADPSPDFNNTPFVKVGRATLACHVSEYLMCRFPRLPVSVLHGAVQAYAGPKALDKIAHEWGVESAAYPGHEVDPGLLQFDRKGLPPTRDTLNASVRPGPAIPNLRRTQASRAVYDDEFGENVIVTGTLEHQTSEMAHAMFVWALIGAIQVHAGRSAAAQFIKGHVLSRRIDLTSMFFIHRPPRHLNRLCARENFEYPIARILSETGRQSRHPVYVVGVFSGSNKLGEGAAGNLNEARVRACVAALKSWYLYSPSNDPMVPSDEELRPVSGKLAPWKPAHIDIGEVLP